MSLVLKFEYTGKIKLLKRKHYEIYVIEISENKQPRIKREDTCFINNGNGELLDITFIPIMNCCQLSQATALSQKVTRVLSTQYYQDCLTSQRMQTYNLQSFLTLKREWRH